jgi:ribose/xylose/arabinose/galactoside ABC-type transport system permease subunit
MRSPSTDRVKILLLQNGVFVAMILMAALFAALNPRFLSWTNGAVILGQVAELGIMAFPVAFVVMTGQADLSVGSIATLGAVIGGMTLTSTGNVPLGVVAGLAFGALAGALNGIGVGVLRLNSFVVTLGFLSVWGGLALVLTNGKTQAGLPSEFSAFGTREIAGVPIQIVALATMVAGATYVLNRTAKGQEILAIGGNARAAHLMGIRVAATQVQVFVVAGLFSAAAGLMLAAKLAAVSPTVGAGMELRALTVVLLGGVSFAGGSGRISGVLAGLLFVGVLNNGLVILGVSPYLQTVLVGATLVFAVLMDSSIRRLVHATWTGRAKRLADDADPSDPPSPVPSVASVRPVPVDDGVPSPPVEPPHRSGPQPPTPPPIQNQPSTTQEVPV